METYEEILKRMEDAYEQESGRRAEDVSDAGLRIRVLAGELYRLRTELAWLKRQAFPETADGEWLDRHGESRGVKRKEAEKAVGKITFSRYLPLSFDVVIPAGTVCAVSGEDPVEFETLEDGIMAAGALQVEIPARAVIGGPAGNTAAGYVNTLTAPVSGVNYVTNKVPFTGGRDPEPDEEYRIRVLAAYSSPSNGTNAGYYQTIAMGWEGVRSVQVVPRINGAGTVGVYVWGENGAPDEKAVAGLREELARRREIGVDVTVQAAAAKTVDVSFRMKLKAGADFPAAKAAAEQAVKNCFSGLPVGSPLYLAELERAVLNAAPVAKLEFPSTMRDVAAEAGAVPVAGTVTAEELA